MQQFAVGSAAMRHSIAAPTFLLSRQKKSRRRSGGKENRLGMSWPPMGQLTQNEGPAATNCRESSVAFYRLRR